MNEYVTKWKYVKSEKKIIAPNGNENDFAVVALIPSNISEEEQDANGTLIARAPWLLGVCEEVKKSLLEKNQAAGKPLHDWEIASLEIAIARAKGEDPYAPIDK